MSEEKKNIKINVTPKGDEVTILQGKANTPALPENIKREVSIKGLLDYLEKRKDVIDPKKSHIVVNSDNKNVVYYENEHQSDGNKEITGIVNFNKDLEDFGINTDKVYSTNELSDFIRRNTLCLESRMVALKLSKELKEFRGKVNKELESKSDDRGNDKFTLEQVVESNIPASFTLKVPLFLGEKPMNFSVEIFIDASFSCQLFSIDLIEAKKKEVDKTFNKFKKDVEEIIPKLPVMEM